MLASFIISIKITFRNKPPFILTFLSATSAEFGISNKKINKADSGEIAESNILEISPAYIYIICNIDYSFRLCIIERLYIILSYVIRWLRELFFSPFFLLFSRVAVMDYATPIDFVWNYHSFF